MNLHHLFFPILLGLNLIHQGNSQFCFDFQLILNKPVSKGIPFNGSTYTDVIRYMCRYIYTHPNQGSIWSSGILLSLRRFHRCANNWCYPLDRRAFVLKRNRWTSKDGKAPETILSDAGRRKKKNNQPPFVFVTILTAESLEINKAIRMQSEGSCPESFPMGENLTKIFARSTMSMYRYTSINVYTCDRIYLHNQQARVTSHYVEGIFIS